MSYIYVGFMELAVGGFVILLIGRMIVVFIMSVFRTMFGWTDY